MQKKQNIVLVLICAILLTFPCVVYAGKYDTARASIPVSFIASGTGGDFTAVMEPLADAPAPLNTKAAVHNSGESSFEIDINMPGTYRYRVYQEISNEGSIDYDRTVYTVIVYATEDRINESLLRLVVTAAKSGSEDKPDKIEFDNRDKANKGDEPTPVSETTTQGGGGNSGGGGSTDETSKTGSTPGGGGSSTVVPNRRRPPTDDNDNNNNNNNNNDPDTPDAPGSIDVDTPDTPDVRENSGENADNNSSAQTDTDENIGIGRDGNDPGNKGELEMNVKNKTDDNTANTADETVNTGDNSKQSLWLALMCVSLVIMAASTVLEKIRKTT